MNIVVGLKVMVGLSAVVIAFMQFNHEDDENNDADGESDGK